MSKGPHKDVGAMVDNVAGTAESTIRSLASTVKGMGSQLMSTLDEPVKAITKKPGPHRMVDNVLDGGVDAGVNMMTNGMIGSARIVGHSVMNAMDNPFEQLQNPSLNMPKL